MDPSQAPKIAFAQPIVFFRLDSHLSDLAQSPYLSSVTSFRLRIPARPVAGPLTASPLSLPSSSFSICRRVTYSAPSSQTHFGAVNKTEAPILDGGSLLRGEYHPEDWAVLGKGCALAGLETAPAPRQERRPRRGRRGVSTATISLRESPPPETRVVGVVDTPTATAMRKIRLYPASPGLCSFATTLPPSVPPEKHAEIREQFEKGWFEVRARLYQSYRLGSTIMKFVDADESDGSDEGLDGLVEVNSWEDDVDIKAPVLCFVGPAKSEAHEAGCAHSVAWTVWKD
ncbi:hypothetical protein B0H13DRAFT_1982174 [Mycena leptocephala]|nr:hypothetical protein B0H13DRAFT_1982174 [Mycena leptocephala]